MAHDKMKVCLWENEGMMREKLASVIRELPSFTLCQHQANHDYLRQIKQEMPNLLILDIDDTALQPVDMILQVRQIVPNLLIIGMSRQWDDPTVKRYIASGFNAYLTKPFTATELLQAVHAIDINGKTSLQSSEVISFFSPKGKTGRTTLTVNLAMALAKKTNQPVGIIDADTSFADMEAFLNLAPPSTLIEAVRDLDYLSPSTLSAYFEKVNDQVKVLCGPKRPEFASLIKPESLTKLIQMAQRNFRYVLVDIPAGFQPISVAVAEVSDHIYLTEMIDGMYEIEHMKRALDIFQSLERWQERVRVVFTRTDKLDPSTINYFEQQLGSQVVLIPNEYLLVAAAANNGRMALDIGPDSPLTKRINQLADSICR